MFGQKKNSSEGIYFTYSDSERFLIDYLQNNATITFSKFIRKAHISRKRAEEILTNFVLMDIVRMNTKSEGTSFHLNKMFDENVLKKFGEV